MIRNYLKLAWRNIWKNKLFSAINIISLAIGLSASFVIGIMCYYDFSFDTFHSEKETIYRVTSIFESPDGIGHNAGVPLPMPKYLKDEVSGIDAVAPIFPFGANDIKNPDSNAVYEANDYNILTTSDYFKIFDYQFLAGSKQQALVNPNEVVLTEERAKYYFPNQDLPSIIGKTLIYNETIPLKVSGIVASFKQRSDIVFEEFVSLEAIKHTRMADRYKNGNWNSTSSGNQVFIKVKSNEALPTIKTQLAALAESKITDDDRKYNESRVFFLQPLADLHFNNDFGIFNFTKDQANKTTLYCLIVVALFLLLLGCVNFINLNTAQATQRAKEIGIRKTLGGSKSQLIVQFLGETFLLTMIAALLSLALAKGMLLLFADFIPSGVRFSLIQSPVIIIGIIAVLILVTFLSGLYPALILSNYKPVLVLKGELFNPKNKSNFRKVLTVFQFSIAQIFIISTLLVGKQIHFLLNKDMGFQTEAIASVRMPWSDRTVDNKLLLAEKLRQLPQIRNVAIGGNTPASRSIHKTGVSFKDGKNEVNMGLELLYGDPNYLKLYDIQLLAGRHRLNDTIKEMVINEACLAKLGFTSPNEAIGKTLLYDEENVPIVGVMKNFHQRSLRSTIEPMAMIGDWSRKWRTAFSHIHLVLDTSQSGEWKGVIANIETAFNTVYPEESLRFQFMDETIQRFYKREQNLSKLLSWATGLSILISCLGLLGLVIYTTERRIKEIGIRKVLGATVSQLNSLLCKEFVWLVGIAFIIAAPIAYYGLHQWIQDYAFRTDLSWWVFVVSGLLMALVALVIMSVKTIRVAMRNPVNSLRTE